MIPGTTSQTSLLTILVEELFSCRRVREPHSTANWSNFEPRYEKNTLKTLDLLDQFDTKSNFFCPRMDRGANPNLIRESLHAARGRDRGFYHGLKKSNG